MKPPIGEQAGLNDTITCLRKTLWAGRWVILCVVLVLMISCGKKGPPIPPKSKIPSTVQSINSNVQGSTVRLYWSVGEPGAPESRDIVSFRVYRSVRLATAARCPGCPMPFELTGEVLAATASEAGTVEFVDELKPGNIYYYKIVPVSKDGLAGEASEVIQVKPQ